MCNISTCRNAVFLLLICLATTQLIGQNLLEGRVMDAVSDMPLANVNVHLPAIGSGTASDADGRFSLEVSQFPTNLEFSFIGYETTVLEVSQLPENELIVRLVPIISDLSEVVVKVVRPSEPLTEKTRSVVDFVAQDSLLLLVTTTGEGRTNCLELRSLEGDLTDSFDLAELSGTKFFHKNCLGNINLVNRDKVLPLNIRIGRFLGFGLAMDYAAYQAEVMPCVHSNPDFYYFQYIRLQGQKIDFELFAKANDSHSIFATFVDEENILRFYEDMVSGILADQGVAAASLSSGSELANLRNEQEDIDARMQFFYQPLNVSLHGAEGELVIFNHFEGKLQFYLSTGEPLRELDIEYHLNKKWDKTVLQDELTGKFYTLFSDKKDKAIFEVNLMDGSLGEPIVFECRFPKKMTVHGGHLYFLDSGISGHLSMNQVLRKLRL